MTIAPPFRWHARHTAGDYFVNRSNDGDLRLGGLHIIQYNLRSGREDGLHEPAYLHDVEAFATWLEQQPEVTNADRVTQLLARLNMNMHEDNPAFRLAPASREVAAQLLLL